MKKYYTHNGTDAQGPFDLDELRLQEVTKETLVWTEETPDWHAAGEIEELNELFESPSVIKSETDIISKPVEPAKPKSAPSDHTPKEKWSFKKYFVWAVLVIVFIV